MGILTENYNLIINNLDVDSIDVNAFRHGGANITTFRIISLENPEWLDFNEHLHKQSGYSRGGDRVLSRVNAFAVEESAVDSDDCSFDGAIAFAVSLMRHLSSIHFIY